MPLQFEEFLAGNSASEVGCLQSALASGCDAAGSLQFEGSLAGNSAAGVGYLHPALASGSVAAGSLATEFVDSAGMSVPLRVPACWDSASCLAVE